MIRMGRSTRSELPDNNDYQNNVSNPTPSYQNGNGSESQ